MNPEISQNQESSPIQVTDALPNPENQNSEMSKNSSELKKFSPESIDQVKIMFQPIKDQISTIDSIYQNALGVQTSLNNDSNIIIEEIPQTKITKKIVTTTKTVIKNGKETTTTTKKEELINYQDEKMVKNIPTKNNTIISDPVFFNRVKSLFEPSKFKNVKLFDYSQNIDLIIRIQTFFRNILGQRKYRILK